jgi:hypothetical protein
MIDPQHFLIRDSFRGTGEHTFQLNFHLHPDLVPKQTSNGWRLAHADAVVHLSLLKDDQAFDIIKGRTDPLMGWYSPAYGVLRETHVLSTTRQGQPGDISFMTAISINTPLSNDQFMENTQWLLNAA